MELIKLYNQLEVMRGESDKDSERYLFSTGMKQT